MFDAVRNNPKIVQIFLLIIILPFAFFGIDSYFRGGSGGREVVARVGSVEILNQQLDQAIREQEGALRAQLGAAFDRSMLDSPEYRAGILDRLINQAALKSVIKNNRMAVPGSAIQDYVKSRPEFQDNGRFSLQLYDAILASQGKSRDSYERSASDIIAERQALAPVVMSAFTPVSTAERWIELDKEERTVSSLVFDAKSFLVSAKATPDMLKAYYDSHQVRFELPEQAKFEYIELSLDDLAKQVQVSEDEARVWYNDNIKNLSSPDERRASHILVQVAPNATAAEKAAARVKAEALLAKVKAAPAQFSAIAKASSDDKISAEQGGDLGFFGRDAMVKPVEDAAFSLKPKEISGVVESQFGFHILMLTEVRGGARSFADAKAEALDGARKQAANKRFAELAEQLGNIVYEQPDSLEPAAEKLSLKIKKTDWLPRGSDVVAVLQNPKVQAALFSTDSLTARRNTEAIDLGDGRIVSGRVLEYKPASVRSFEEVSALVESLVKAEEASKQAKAQGEAALAKLVAGESVVKQAWKPAQQLKRSSADFDQAARKLVFAAKADKLPAYVGLQQDQNYVVYRIDAIKAPKAGPADAAQVAELRKAYANALGEEDLRAYIRAVREQLGVKIIERK